MDSFNHIKTILLDRDGTLCQRSLRSDIVKLLSSALKVEYVEFEQILLKNRWESESELIQCIRRTYQDLTEQTVLDALNITQFLDRIVEEHKSFTPYSDSIDAITKLKKQGLTIGIVSDAIPPYASASIHEEILFGLVDHLFFSCNVGATKKTVDMYHKIASEASINLQEAIMVGDNLEKDVLNAQKAGVNNAILIRHEETESREIYPHVFATNEVDGIKIITNLQQLVQLFEG